MTDAQTWLNRILSGETPTAETIDELRKCPEDLHLDFKGGKATGEKKQRNDIVREYASAFSNAEGGLLVFGVDDSTKALVPCEPVGDRTLDEWAKSCVIDIAHLLQPPPRFHTVEIEGGQALVIAFARAPQLVPVIDGGKWRYFLRFHDANKELPDYLLADLLLGRRQRPTFSLTRYQNLTPGVGVAGGTGLLRTINVSFGFTVENTSLVAADDVEVAVLGWTCRASAPEVGDHLRRYIDSNKPTDFGAGPDWRVVRQARSGERTGESYAIRGLGRIDVTPSGLFELPVVTGLLRGSFAVYVLAKGHEPAWFEVVVTISCPPMGFSEQPQATVVDIQPVVGRRPVVAWGKASSSMPRTDGGIA